MYEMHHHRGLLHDGGYVADPYDLVVLSDERPIRLVKLPLPGQDWKGAPASPRSAPPGSPPTSPARPPGHGGGRERLAQPLGQVKTAVVVDDGRRDPIKSNLTEPLVFGAVPIFNGPTTRARARAESRFVASTTSASASASADKSVGAPALAAPSAAAAAAVEIKTDAASSRKRKRPDNDAAAAAAAPTGGALIHIERVKPRHWQPKAIAQFRVDTSDFVAEYGKARKIAEHLRDGHCRRIKREFAAFVQPLVTILCSEETVPHERKRFTPEVSQGRSAFRIGNCTCVLVFDSSRLVDTVKQGKFESALNDHNDAVWTLPVDGIMRRVHSVLSVICMVKDTCILVTATEPVVAAHARHTSAGAGAGGDSAADDAHHVSISKTSTVLVAADEMSDPRFASGQCSKPAMSASASASMAMRMGLADSCDHARKLQLRQDHVAALLADESRQSGSCQIPGTPFFELPIELFWFMTNFFLTARDCCHLSGTCVFAFDAIHSNVKYWKRAFQCLGNIPLFVNVHLFENDVVPIRRWSIIAMIKRRQEQRVHDYNNQVALAVKLPNHEERTAQLNSLKSEFLRKRHACPLCFNQVSFQYQLNSSISKKNGFGAVFMACEQCCMHNVWSHTQALVIWGFTEGQLRDLARYTMSGIKFYCTADLLWLRERKFPLYTGSLSEAELTLGQRARLVDLPLVVALQLRMREQIIDAHGVVWERTLNVGTGATVLQAPAAAPAAPERQPDGQPLNKRRRCTTKTARAPDAKMSAAEGAEGADQGGQGLVSAALEEEGNVGPTPFTVLATFIQYPLAKRSSYPREVFDPR